MWIAEILNNCCHHSGDGGYVPISELTPFNACCCSIVSLVCDLDKCVGVYADARCLCLDLSIKCCRASAYPVVFKYTPEIHIRYYQGQLLLGLLYKLYFLHCPDTKYVLYNLRTTVTVCILLLLHRDCLSLHMNYNQKEE